MKCYKIKRIVVLLIVLGFFTAGFLPIVSSSYLSQDKSNIEFIGLEDAQLVAEYKISLSKYSDYVIFESFEIKSEVEVALMYVFLLEPTGYIVVPASKKLPPVIAYSYDCDFGGIAEDNVLLQMLKADISRRIENIDSISEDIINTRFEQWQEYLYPKIRDQPRIVTTLSSIGPLLETKWSQGAPYNNFCPIDKASGERSVAGCPAVAMAQILNYHRTTQGVQFSDDDDYYHSYAGNSYTIDDDYIEYDFPSFPELNVYLDTLLYNYENELELTDDDKAAINFACGVACKQVYNPAGSGTFGVDQAFDAYLRFGFEGIELLVEGPSVYERLEANILDGLPAHIAVVDEGWTKGHNMVVDGFDFEGGYFHINFGWGGSYDGWYMLPEELPFELTFLEGLIVDIEPSAPGGLVANGFLNWYDVIPGATVTGNFTIQNAGEQGSSIDWEVSSWPSWGDWTFNPSSGEDLKPEDGEIPIEVSVIVPDEKNEVFSGYIKVVNTQNSSDYCLVHISLTTPRSCVAYHFVTTNHLERINHLFLQFLQRYPFLFWIVNNIISLNL